MRKEDKERKRLDEERKTTAQRPRISDQIVTGSRVSGESKVNTVRSSFIVTKTYTDVGSYTIQIFGKETQAFEHFIIRLSNEGRP